MDNKMSQEEKTIHAYEDIFPARIKKRSHSSTFWLNSFKHFQQLQPTGKILDIGCGIAINAKNFANNGYGYIGIDASEAALKIARKNNPGIEFIQMNMHRLNFPDNYFDGFWATVSLLHISKAKITSILQEIHRVVKNSGHGFISMQKGSEEKMIPSPDAPGKERFFALYQLDEFANILENNNFEVIHKDSPKNIQSRNPRSGESWLVYFVKAV